MGILVIIIKAIYVSYFLNYCGKLLEYKLPKWCVLILLPLLDGIGYFLEVKFRVIIPIAYITHIFAYFIMIYISFKGKIGQIYWASLNVSFHMMVVNGLVIGCMSLIINKNMYQIIEDNYLFYWSVYLTCIMLLLALILFTWFVKVNTIKILNGNHGQLKFLYTIQTVMVLFLVFNSYAYYYNLDLIWFTIFHVLTSGFLLIGFYIAFTMAVRTASWFNEEISRNLYCQGLEKRLQVYQDREKLLEMIRRFNHDTKEIISNVQAFLNNGEIAEAQKLLMDMGIEMKCSIQQEKKYSNHITVNILLQETAVECKEDSIDFTAECFIPANMKLTNTQLYRILNNLSSNAIEACRKQKFGEKRWIEFKSFLQEGNLVLSVRNSFNGMIEMDGKELITTKKNKDYHGHGIKSIKEIVEEGGGLSQIQIERDKHIFSFLIWLPVDMCEEDK